MGNAVKPFGDNAVNVLKQTPGPTSKKIDTATFAAGCFWGLELAFQRVPGVIQTEVGYTQGNKKNPTYEEVCSGSTGHTEAVQVRYDPHMVSYTDLLTVFWDRLDPTTKNRQGNDIGTQYRSGIYYHNEEQKKAIFTSKEKEQLKYDKPIVTEIASASEWHPAEAYHQQYLSKGGQCSLKGDLTPIRCYG